MITGAPDNGHRRDASAIPVRRILLLGCAGAGKTQLANRLAQATGLPTYHLDDEHFGPGWEMLTPAEWVALQQSLTAKEEWIIEGNWVDTIPVRVARAQLVILLDSSAPLCLYRVIRRAWRIRRGDYSALPARVRAKAEAGKPFNATSEFHQLLWAIISFRFRTWGKVFDSIVVNSSAELVVAVAPGHRTRSVRHRLCRRSVDAKIVPVDDIQTIARARAAGMPGAPTGKPSVRRTERGNR